MSDKSHGVFRVNYYLGGQPATAFVCAQSDTEAATFLGVTDGSASVTRIAYPVEIVGIDPPHATIPPLPVNTAPFDLPRNVGRAEFDALQKQVNDLASSKKIKSA